MSLFLLFLKGHWRGVLVALAGLMAVVWIAAFLAHVRGLERDNAAKARALHRAADALQVASAEIAARDTLISKVSDHEARDAGETASFWKGQTHAAYAAGFAARHCPGDTGVRDDLQDVWAVGAFRDPSGPVPRQPDQAH